MFVTETTIYALIDPRNGNVRYVGRADDPQRRLQEHIRAGRTFARRHAARWITGLISRGLLPIMKVLEVCSLDLWQERERYWIAHYKREKLTNMTDGGYGATKRIVAAETRAKLSAHMATRILSADAQARCEAGWRKSIEARRGNTEYRAKLSASLKGRKLTPEQRERHLIALRNRRPLSPESCAKLAATRRRQWKDPEYRSKMLMAKKSKKRLGNSNDGQLSFTI